ncbi:MAG: sortase [Anaerolineales bacterium]|nr:sortase [Anaerolineales bacterium]
MEAKNPKSNILKSTLMILVGSVLLGLVIGKSIYQYRQNHNVLDEVVIISDEADDAPPTFLDLSSTEIPRQEESQVLSQVEKFVQTEYSDDELLEEYYSKVPKYITIPVIGLNAEIGYSGVRNVEVDGEMYKQWISPNDEVGWHYDSAVLGEIGNTVLNGHHNIFGEVFRDLHKVQKGDEIILQSEKGNYHYVVVATMILPERFESKEVRLQNAKWIQTSKDERVTLITCWPYESNTHRVIVVAFPTGEFTPAGQGSITVDQLPLPDPLENQ